jgi:hypothetical protein
VINIIQAYILVALSSETEAEVCLQIKLEAFILKITPKKTKQNKKNTLILTSTQLKINRK